MMSRSRTPLYDLELKHPGTLAKLTPDDIKRINDIGHEVFKKTSLSMYGGNIDLYNKYSKTINDNINFFECMSNPNANPFHNNQGITNMISDILLDNVDAKKYKRSRNNKLILDVKRRLCKTKSKYDENVPVHFNRDDNGNFYAEIQGESEKECAKIAKQLSKKYGNKIEKFKS